MTSPVWLDDTFILSLVGLLGGGGLYLLSYFLKSRCRMISCCCLKCERDVIPPADLNSVVITSVADI